MEISAPKITLYHGSKAVLQGAIAPIRRDRCDFGKGFYMGTEKVNSMTLFTLDKRQLCDIQGCLFELALQNG